MRSAEQEKNQRNQVVTLFSLLIVFVLVSGWRIAESPSLSFDEGWVLTVAKNWAENRGYTQFLLDKPLPPRMLNIGFPAIAPISLSFRIFGVGIWQGRVSSVFLTALSLVLLYFLSARLFNARAASKALLGLFLLSGVLHPMIWGKQAIGESAASFYLLAGFAVFLVKAGPRGALLALSGMLLGLACVTKQQFLPFVVAALLAPLVLAAFHKSWQQVRLLIYWLGSMGLSLLVLLYLQWKLVGAQTLTEPGLYSSTAFVTIPGIRLMVVLGLLTQGLPTVLGLFHACRFVSLDFSSRERIVGLALLTFLMSWMAWYAFCSVGWARYMYPCLLAAAPFVGQFLDSLIQKTRQAWEQRRFWAGSIRALLAAGLVICSGSFTTAALWRNFAVQDRSLVYLAGFLNGLKDRGVIESSDMEVFFMLNTRNYHHPPDRIQLLLNRRGFLGENLTIDYDPLAADPEYLVIGPASRGWRIYEQVISSPRFICLGQAGNYEVYKRVRPGKPGGQRVVS